MLQEITKAEIIINKNIETHISWHNSSFTVRTDKGIQIFKLSHDFGAYCKEISKTCSFIPLRKRSPSADFFCPEMLKRPIKNLEYTQMIMDPGFWAHSPHLLDELSCIRSSAWSPENLYDNNGRILAVLNNVGNIDLYVEENHFHRHIFNLSCIIKTHYLESINKNPPFKDLEELKAAVKAVQTVCMCWGPMPQNNTCYLATSQKNGNILIWLVQSEQKVQVKLLSVIETVEEVLEMSWVKEQSDNSFILICANAWGQIILMNFQIGENISSKESHRLWPYKDRVVPKCFLHLTIKNKLVILCAKHRHLVIYLLDDNYNLLSQVTKNMNDHRITDMKTDNSSVYIGTVNCKIYRTKLNIVENNIDVEVEEIELKNQYPMYDLHSFDFSPNKAVFIIGVYNRAIQHRKESDKLDLVFFHDVEIDEVNILVNNPTNMLTHYWDCVHVLRYKTMKKKFIPELDFTELYNDGNENVYKLKLYLILLTLYSNLEHLAKNTKKHSWPEMSIETVKEKIILTNAKTIMNSIFSDYQSKQSEMGNLEVESFAGAKNYIEYYCKKHNKHREDIIDESVWNWNKNVYSYTCQSCDEGLQGFSCSKGHLNMFCMLTLTPIESCTQYLVCTDCNSTARIEMYEKTPLCIFCDMHLNKI